MYKIVNKATFITDDTIKEYIKKSIKLINTTSLSDNKSYLRCSGNTYLLLCSFPMLESIAYYIAKINKNRTNFRKNVF